MRQRAPSRSRSPFVPARTARALSRARCVTCSSFSDSHGFEGEGDVETRILVEDLETRLSARQQKILRGLLRGHTWRQIGDELGCTSANVAYHVRGIRAAYAELTRDDADASFAVRSSATAEDLPEASFAGQQETRLGVLGDEAVLAAIESCWKSLHTDRAVAYRQQKGIDETGLAMAVVVPWRK